MQNFCLAPEKIPSIKHILAGEFILNKFSFKSSHLNTSTRQELNNLLSPISEVLSDTVYTFSKGYGNKWNNLRK